MLLELGIQHMQGFLFSRAVVDALPIDDVYGVDNPVIDNRFDQRPSLLASLGLGSLPAFTLPA